MMSTEEDDALLSTPRAGKRAASPRAVLHVSVTQDGAPLSGVQVALSRSISGRHLDYRSQATTDGSGEATIELLSDQSSLRSGVSGYYLARAVDPSSGAILGQWGSIPINGGRTLRLSAI